LGILELRASSDLAGFGDLGASSPSGKFLIGLERVLGRWKDFGTLEGLRDFGGISRLGEHFPRWSIFPGGRFSQGVDFPREVVGFPRGSIFPGGRFSQVVDFPRWSIFPGGRFSQEVGFPRRSIRAGEDSVRNLLHFSGFAKNPTTSPTFGPLRASRTDGRFFFL